MPIDAPPKIDGPPASRSQRTQPRELRRRQLIEATIDCVAERGLAETRMADVAARAGMSVGLVNFHFDSKQTLLAETLRYLSDEFRRAWREARDGAANDPASQLEALVRMNFESHICNTRRIAVWFAFFGESRSRSIYTALCQEFDDDYLAQLAALFGTLPGFGPARAGRASITLQALVDGMWQHVLLNPNEFTAAKARDICLEWLRGRIGGHPGRRHRKGDP